MMRNRKTRSLLNAAILVAAFGCAQFARADDAAPAADPYAAALEHFQASQWDDAAAKFRTALDDQADDPRATSARLYLAEALLRANRPADAAVEYRAFLADDVADDSRPTAAFRLVEALYVAGDHEAAVDAAERFLTEHAHHDFAARAWFYLGDAQYRLGDYAAAEAALARLTAEFPDDAQAERAAVVQAACLIQLGRYPAAWTVLTARLVDDAGDHNPLVEELAGITLVAHGETAEAAGNLDEAEARYEQLLRDFARHDRASYAAFRLAQVAMTRGDWPTAAARFAAVAERTDAAELAPPARLGQVQALAQDRKWDDVLEIATAAAERHAEWSQVYEFHYLRGRALIAKARLNEAREALALVLAVPGAADSETAVLARFMTAETHFLQHAYDAALAEYERVAARDDFADWQRAAVLQCDKCRAQLDLQRK